MVRRRYAADAVDDAVIAGIVEHGDDSRHRGEEGSRRHLSLLSSRLAATSQNRLHHARTLTTFSKGPFSAVSSSPGASNPPKLSSYVPLSVPRRITVPRGGSGLLLAAPPRTARR